MTGASKPVQNVEPQDAPTARIRERTGSFGVVVSRFRGQAQHHINWRDAVHGEQVAAELERRTADDNVLWMHDRTRAGTVHADIDHIAIGPGGATVIESKDLSGKVRVTNAGGMFGPRMDSLMVNNRDHTALVAHVEQQVEAVRDLLALRGMPHVDVRGAICLGDSDGLPIFRRLRVRDVLIDNNNSIAALAARSGPLNSETVAVLHAHIASAMPPA